MKKLKISHYLAHCKKEANVTALSKEDIDNFDLSEKNVQGEAYFFRLFQKYYQHSIESEIDYFLGKIDLSSLNGLGQSVIMCVVEKSLFNSIVIEELTWDKLFNDCDLSVCDAEQQNLLFLLLSCDKENLKNNNIHDRHFNKVVNTTLNSKQENEAVKNTIDFIVENLEEMPGDIKRIWSHLEDKDWFINYIENSKEELHKDILKCEEIKTYKEKQQLEKIIEKTNNKIVSKL